MTPTPDPLTRAREAVATLEADAERVAELAQGAEHATREARADPSRLPDLAARAAGLRQAHAAVLADLEAARAHLAPLEHEHQRAQDTGALAERTAEANARHADALDAFDAAIRAILEAVRTAHQARRAYEAADLERVRAADRLGHRTFARTFDVRAAILRGQDRHASEHDLADLIAGRLADHPTVRDGAERVTLTPAQLAALEAERIRAWAAQLDEAAALKHLHRHLTGDPTRDDARVRAVSDRLGIRDRHALARAMNARSAT
jgi:hypothetical protein